jgi:hypothetical protein
MGSWVALIRTGTAMSTPRDEASDASRQCRILFLQDEPSELCRVRLYLQDRGWTVSLHGVATRSALDEALTAGSWDAVLVAQGVGALGLEEIFAALAPLLAFVPMILLAEDLSDEQANDLCGKGCWAWVGKDRLVGFSGVLDRCLREAKERREGRELRDQLALMASTVPGLVCSFRLCPRRHDEHAVRHCGDSRSVRSGTGGRS